MIDDLGDNVGVAMAGTGCVLVLGPRGDIERDREPDLDGGDNPLVP